MPPIRVAIADDHILFRSALASLFAAQPDFVLVGEADSCQSAIAMAMQARPDVFLLDVRMPGSGMAALRAIRAALPQTRVVMLTASEDETDLLDAVKAGAVGYLLKSTPPADFFEHLRAVMRGEAAIAGELSARLLQAIAGRPQAPSVDALTERELDVLRRIAAGASNREIAVQLSITENTVKKHTQRILEKLHLQNRTQAAAYALRAGLVTASD